MMIMEKFHVDENKSWFHKWWPEGVPFNTEFEEISLGDFFEKQRKKYPDSNVIWFMDTWMTYDEIGKYIDSFATALHNFGIRKGDVVAFLLPNCFQYVISFYACAKLGVISTGINPT
ncbi:MAG: AMP-binding protein, partial [Promethearchaeota archaeon]